MGKRKIVVVSRYSSSEFCYATNLDDIHEGIRKIPRCAVPINNDEVSYDPTKTLGTIAFRCESQNCLGILQALNSRTMYLSWICIDDFKNDSNQIKVLFDTDTVRDKDNLNIPEMNVKHIKVRYVTSLKGDEITNDEFKLRCAGKHGEYNSDTVTGQTGESEKTVNENVRSGVVMPNNNSANNKEVVNGTEHENAEGYGTHEKNNYIQSLAHREAALIVKETEIEHKLQEVDKLLGLANKIASDANEQAKQEKENIAIDVDNVYAKTAEKAQCKGGIGHEVVMRSLYKGDRVHISREYIDSISVFYKKGIETTSDLSRYKAIVVIQFEKKSINNIIAILEYDEKEELAVVEILSPFGANNTSDSVIEQYYSKYLQQRKKNMVTGW